VTVHKVPLRTHVARYRWLYILLLPGMVYFAIFRYAPMYGVTIAFQNYLPFLGFSGSPWVGLTHFQTLFASPDFPRVLGNTLILALLNVVFVFPAPIIVALLLNELRLGMLRRAIQSSIYIPHFLSWTIVAALTYLLFALDTGPITHLMNTTFDGHFAFLSDPDWFRPLIVVQTLWKSTGWGTIVYLAALASVDPHLYEAARMDGANRWQQMRHVTLPGIRSTIVVMSILTAGHLLDTSFEQVYLLTNSLNRSVAEVFDTYVYFLGITQGAYSYSTAAGLFKAILGVILVFGANWVARRFKQPGLF
jgi:putative aldouronate transport system permease protein